MEPQNLTYIKNNYRIKIGVFDLILSYMSLVFMIVFPWLIFTIPLIYRLLAGHSVQLGLVVASFSMTIIVFAIAYTIPRKLKLSRIGSASNADLSNKIIYCFKELGWSYSQISESEFTGSTPISWYSWGESISIVCIDNDVYINSLGKTSPITFGKDKKNIERFRKVFLTT